MTSNTKTTLNYGKNHKCVSKGETIYDYIVLFDLYDEKQLWLPFDRTLFNFVSETANTRKKITNQQKNNLKKILDIKEKKQYFSVDNTYRKLYDFSEYGNQYPLPFHEGRKLSANDYSTIEKQGFIWWQKTHNHRVYTIMYDRYNIENKRECIKWCDSFCTGFYHVHSNSIYVFASFAKKDDAVIAKVGFPIGKDLTDAQ